MVIGTATLTQDLRSLALNNWAQMITPRSKIQDKMADKIIHNNRKKKMDFLVDLKDSRTSLCKKRPVQRKLC